MSVLIKGMEMPHNCFLCPLSVMNGERVYCEVTKDEVLRAKIAQDCPLIELPPHGRLIDADAFLQEFTPTKDDEDTGAKLLLAIFCQIVKDAPTILEAEGIADEQN